MEKQSFKCIGGINLPLCFLLLNFLCNEGLPIGLGQRLVIAWTANTYVPPGIQFPPLSLNLAGIALHVQALSQPYPRWCQVFYNLVNPHHLMCHSYFQVFSEWQHVEIPLGSAMLIANNAEWPHALHSVCTGHDQFYCHGACCSVQSTK